MGFQALEMAPLAACVVVDVELLIRSGDFEPEFAVQMTEIKWLITWRGYLGCLAGRHLRIDD